MLLLEQPFESVRSMADGLGFSRETVRLVLTRQLHMSKFVLHLVPHTLNAEQKRMRVERATDILEHLQSPGGRENVVTGDETWVYHEHPHDSMWAVSGGDVGTRVAHTINSKKTMITVLWTIKGFLVVDALPDGSRFNSSYAASLLHKLSSVVRESRPVSGLSGLFLHWDNARPHISTLTQGVVEELGLRRLCHPPYSPDLAPNDFFLFENLKRVLKGSTFASAEELLAVVQEKLPQISKDVLASVFEEWAIRLHAVIESGGEYYVK